MQKEIMWSTLPQCIGKVRNGIFTMLVCLHQKSTDTTREDYSLKAELQSSKVSHDSYWADKIIKDKRDYVY